jgi:hypothetical protein
MIIPKSIEYQIESHFFCYEEEKKQAEILERDIAEAITPNLDGVGGSSGTSDPTAQKAAQIERETKELRSWVNVVEQTIRRYQDDPVGDFIVQYYFSGKNAQISQMELHIGTTTFYARRKAVIIYAALKASTLNLISI